MKTHKFEKQLSVVTHTIENVIGLGNLSLYDQLIAKDIVSHCPESWSEIHPIEIRGLTDAKQMDAHYAHAFHPISLSIDEIVSYDKDKFFIRWRCEKFHAHAFYAIQATNRPVFFGGQTIYHLNEEMKIKESWHSWDMLGLLRQIGWQPQLPFSSPNQSVRVLAEKFSSLSDREKECLFLQLNGKTAKETAQLLFLSPRTIEYHFENIKNKLDCKNKREALALMRILEKNKLLF